MLADDLKGLQGFFSFFDPIPFFGLTFVLLIGLPGNVAANCHTSVEFIGFSASGSHFAWEQFGVQDGSGFPHCEIVIQEVDGGRVVERFEVLLEDEFEGLEHARNLCLSEAADALASLADDEWLQGVHCVQHPPTDLTVTGDSVRFACSFLAPGFIIGDLTLALGQEPIPGTEMEEFWGFAPVLLRAVMKDNQTGESLEILDDKVLDPERSYCFGYGIESVWALGDSAFAASIGMLSIGFEGPDLSYFFLSWSR